MSFSSMSPCRHQNRRAACRAAWHHGGGININLSAILGAGVMALMCSHRVLNAAMFWAIADIVFFHAAWRRESIQAYSMRGRCVARSARDGEALFAGVGNC